jgi:alkylation response protein AidB-like acyl-CoA dehydrogenase
VLWGLFGGLSIGACAGGLPVTRGVLPMTAADPPVHPVGLPPIMNFGGRHLQDKVVKDCLQGRKFICLAITEPYAGSDVAGLRTTAVKDPTGKFYVVNGEKKWITNGVFADYFTVAVRTGGSGMDGISLLVVERGPGVTTTQMQCMVRVVRAAPGN